MGTWSLDAPNKQEDATGNPFLPVLFLLGGPGGAESTLRHISAHFCHQLLSWSRTHFILWFHLSRLFLYFIFYNGNLPKWDPAVSCFTHLWDAQVLSHAYLPQGPAHFRHHALDVFLGAAVFSQDPQRSPVNPEKVTTSIKTPFHRVSRNLVANAVKPSCRHKHRRSSRGAREALLDSSDGVENLQHLLDDERPQVIKPLDRLPHKLQHVGGGRFISVA